MNIHICIDTDIYTNIRVEAYTQTIIIEIIIIMVSFISSVTVFHHDQLDDVIICDNLSVTSG